MSLSFAPVSFASEHSPLLLEVEWVDWPNEALAEGVKDDALDYRDPILQRQLRRGLGSILDGEGIGHSAAGSNILVVRVNGMRVVRKYNDSLFGDVRNRPTKYQGTFRIELSRGSKSLSRVEGSFSIDSGRTVGNRIAVAHAKVRGLVEKRFSRFVQSRKFRKLMRAATLAETE